MRTQGACTDRSSSLALCWCLALFLFLAPTAPADLRPLSELAFPVAVGPGTNISFWVNESRVRYLYAAADPGEDPGAPRLQYWIDNGTTRRKESNIAGIGLLNPSQYNLSFETSGRIAVAYYLPGICGWQATTKDLDPRVCPTMTIREPTAFALWTFSVDRPTLVRVEGDVEVSYFDQSLLPVGTGSARRYDGAMMDVVVVVPRGSSAEVTFLIEPAPADPAFVGIVLLLVAVLTVVILVTRALRGSRR